MTNTLSSGVQTTKGTPKRLMIDTCRPPGYLNHVCLYLPHSVRPLLDRLLSMSRNLSNSWAVAVVFNIVLAIVQARDRVSVRLAIGELVNELFELRFNFDYIVVDPVAIVLRNTVLDNTGDVALVVRCLDPFSIGKRPVDRDLDRAVRCRSYVPETHREV